MSDTTRLRPTVSTNAGVTFRQRPALLLMVVRVRAAEATPELGLAGVKQRCAEAVLRLTRLGAARVEAGEPHEDGHGDLDWVSIMRAAAMRRRLRPADAPPARGVNVALTATWDIAGLPAGEVLSLVDRLRFEAAADDDPPDPPDDPPPWAGPEEQLRAAVARMTEPPPDDRSPQFLFVTRPDDEQVARAAAEAYEAARRIAERLAHAAGRRLGDPVMLTHDYPGMDRLMDRQRCKAVLAASSYDLRDREVVSDTLRAVDITVSVHTSYHLE